MGTYTKTYDIVEKLHLEGIEIHKDATIIFDDGDTKNYKAIHFDDNDYIIGEIRKIEYPQEYVKGWWIFKEYKHQDESMNVFVQTGHIKKDSVKAINCKEMKSIYHLDKNVADSKLYRIVDE